jgi:hypothetical protein
MIPYDELVESLANWRSKNGMTTRQVRTHTGSATPAPEEDTNLHAAVPENDFERPEGTGEIDLDSELVYGEDEDV